MNIFSSVLLASAMLLCTTVASFSQTTDANPNANASDDTLAVRLILETYLKGHQLDDPDYIRQAFHPAARVNFIKESKLTFVSFDEYVSYFTRKSADDGKGYFRSIDRIDVTGNAAVGKVTLDYPTVKYTDYMSLLKIDGTWKIINKTPDFVRKPQPLGNSNSK